MIFSRAALAVLQTFNSSPGSLFQGKMFTDKFDKTIALSIFIHLFVPGGGGHFHSKMIGMLVVFFRV